MSSSPDRVKPKTIKLVFADSPINTQLLRHKRSKSKDGWLEVGIMCQSGATCLPVDCCFSELAL